MDQLQPAFFVYRMQEMYTMLEQRKEIQAKEEEFSEAKKTAKKTASYCSLHDELMKIYCFTCSCLICRDCIVIDHAEHKYNFIKTIAPQARDDLVQQLEPLKKTRTDLTCAVDKIKKNASEVEEQGGNIANKIEKVFYIF